VEEEAKKQYQNEKSSQTLLHYQQTSDEETAGIARILMAANVYLGDGNFHSLSPKFTPLHFGGKKFSRWAPLSLSSTPTQRFMILLRTSTSASDVGRFLSPPTQTGIHPRCLLPLKRPKQTENCFSNQAHLSPNKRKL
jgi:hypothetical protein